MSAIEALRANEGVARAVPNLPAAAPAAGSSRDGMRRLPTFSIVIATNGRAASLRATLESLRYLDYPPFEVCVVHGVTPDKTGELLASWHGRLKARHCAERSLTAARNLGIAMAAGEIIAFIDDDAIPEPEWLRDLAHAYDAPDVGGVGGS